MMIHRDRRATALWAKSRPPFGWCEARDSHQPREGRWTPSRGLRGLPGPRLRHAPCHRPSLGDPERCGTGV